MSLLALYTGLTAVVSQGIWLSELDFHGFILQSDPQIRYSCCSAAVTGKHTELAKLIIPIASGVFATECAVISLQEIFKVGSFKPRNHPSEHKNISTDDIATTIRQLQDNEVACRDANSRSDDYPRLVAYVTSPRRGRRRARRRARRAKIKVNNEYAGRRWGRKARTRPTGAAAAPDDCSGQEAGGLSLPPERGTG
ncbi:hypothetical protein EVAR_39263_1 [Eumeta japonica]|uniref:Uncharacterized protein n=1 Tax=Eumeta variegata TaxID=151549 RepID=A0A4C1VZE0_EUMVA|nr:hypothetical protein EVAR_39263_1 [Eumeta japonica]